MHAGLVAASQCEGAHSEAENLDICMRAAHAEACAHVRTLRALGARDSELQALFSPGVLLQAASATTLTHTKTHTEYAA